MKLPTRGMTQPSNEELRWHYQDAAAAVGQCAAGLEPAIGGTPVFEPSQSQRKAAERDGWIRTALAALTRRQQALLKTCYTAPPGLDMGHGAGDGAVKCVLEASAELAELQQRLAAAKPEQKQLHRERLAAASQQLARDTMGEVKVAHRDYVAARRQMREADRAVQERAATAEQRVMASRSAETVLRRSQRPATVEEFLGPEIMGFIEEARGT